MGLDLILYRKHKNLKDMSLEEELDSQLAYGRKTWAIANFFTRRCKMLEDDWLFEVTKADWDAFIKALSDLRNPDFAEKVSTFVKYRKDALDTDEYCSLYDELGDWLDNALGNDNVYQLGLEWELMAVINWFNADSEVQKAFEEGVPVELIQSY